MNKKAKPLQEWLNDPNTHLTSESLLVKDVDLSFQNFPEFFAKRRAALKQKLIDRVFVASVISPEPANDDMDDEVVEDIVE